MSHFIVDQHRNVLSVDKCLRSVDSHDDFGRFLRREVYGEVIPQESSDKPRYLHLARKFGFQWEPQAESGHVQYDFKANLMRRLVMEYARKLVHDIGFPVYEVSGANMFNVDHPSVSAYASLYGDRLYKFNSSGQDVIMSYDASYPQFNLAAKKVLSYRQLPFAHFSLSDCHRHEQSGELMLLMRQRRFYMPDIHPYFKDIDEAFHWFPRLQEKIIQSAEENGKKYHVAVEISSDDIWRKYRHHIEQIPQWLGKNVLVNIINDGKSRYWAINVDYKIVDKLGQSREIACIQVDMENARRLGIKYADHDGRIRHPVIVHSAIPGGVERFLYVMLDNFDKGFPLWLSPVHIRLVPVNNEFVADCRKIIKELENVPLRIELDDRPQSISAKLKSAHEELVPHKIVIGGQERSEDYADLRRLAKQLADDNAGKPFIQREWPEELSKQLRP